jgi:hypothetical protein
MTDIGVAAITGAPGGVMGADTGTDVAMNDVAMNMVMPGATHAVIMDTVPTVAVTPAAVSTAEGASMVAVATALVDTGKLGYA